MERLCILIDTSSETERRAIHDALTAYAIASDTEVFIKWVGPTARKEEIASAALEAQIAYLSAAEIERAERLGRILYKGNPECALVYYSFSTPQEADQLTAYFSRLFPARPVSYLYRPTRKDFYASAVSFARASAEKGGFLWETKGMQYRIPYAAILYFQSDRNYVHIRLRNGAEYSFLGKLANIEQLVPRSIFVRVHQSYLVNRSVILFVDKGKKSVHLENGEEIFISKAHYRETVDLLNSSKAMPLPPKTPC